MVPPDAAVVVDFRAFLPADRSVRVERSAPAACAPRDRARKSSEPTPIKETVPDVYAGCCALSLVAVPRRDQEWSIEAACECGINMERNGFPGADSLRKVRDPMRDRLE
jgi:hypothetical protein